MGSQGSPTGSQESHRGARSTLPPWIQEVVLGVRAGAGSTQVCSATRARRATASAAAWPMTFIGWRRPCARNTDGSGGNLSGSKLLACVLLCFGV